MATAYIELPVDTYTGLHTEVARQISWRKRVREIADYHIVSYSNLAHPDLPRKVPGRDKVF